VADWKISLTFGTRITTLISEGGYVSQKSTRPRNPGKEQGEYLNFDRLLGKLLKVPASKVKAELEAEKRTPKRKRAAFGHAYRDKD